MADDSAAAAGSEGRSSKVSNKRTGSEMAGDAPDGSAVSSHQPPSKKPNRGEAATASDTAGAPPSASMAIDETGSESGSGQPQPQPQLTPKTAATTTTDVPAAASSTSDTSSSAPSSAASLPSSAETTTNGGGKGRGKGKGKKEKDTSYNRKEKSLGLLCENFLRAFEAGDRPTVSLDAVAKELNVERRRIYDIVNILEAVAVVSRSGKNSYHWHGTTRLAERITSLNSALQDSEAETGSALKNGMATMNRAMMKPDVPSAAGDDSKDASDGEAGATSTDVVMADLVQRNIAVMEGKYVSSTATNTASSSSDSATAASVSSAAGGDAASSAAVAKKKRLSGGRDVRREQSLGHLSAVFVQMFLANDARVVSLEEAARWLLRSNSQQTTDGARSDSDELMTANSQHAAAAHVTLASAVSTPSSSSSAAGKSKDNRVVSLFKSKVRRLYDIANVLSSLRLIEKIQLIQSRRPAFRWLGAKVYPLQSTIDDTAYTKEGSNKNKHEAAPKRRTTTGKQDSSAAAVQVKKEGGAASSGAGSAAGAAGDGSVTSNGSVMQSQTLHSAFSTPGSLAAIHQPLSFSFPPPSVIASTGPSLSHAPGRSALATTTATTTGAGSASLLPVLPSSSSSAPASAVSPSSLLSPSSSSDGSSDGGVEYPIVHRDCLFKVSASSMAGFEPIEFAYLPYVTPPAVPDSMKRHKQHALQPLIPSQPLTQPAAADGNTSLSTDPSTPPPPPPPLLHPVSELPPVVRAAYIRDTVGFLSAFSAACRRWMELIPSMAQQPKQHKHTNGSATHAASPAASLDPSPSSIPTSTRLRPGSSIRIAGGTITNVSR